MFPIMLGYLGGNTKFLTMSSQSSMASWNLCNRTTILTTKCKSPTKAPHRNLSNIAEYGDEQKDLQII